MKKSESERKNESVRKSESELDQYGNEVVNESGVNGLNELGGESGEEPDGVSGRRNVSDLSYNFFHCDCDNHLHVSVHVHGENENEGYHQ